MNKPLIIIKILIAILFLWKIGINVILKIKKNIFNYKDRPIIMGKYGFYNSLNSPLISIILYLTKTNLKNVLVENYALQFLQQTLKNIEIIIFQYYKDSYNSSLINNISSNNKNIHIFISKDRNEIMNIFNMVNIIKGQFLIIVDNLINFEKDELYYFFNFTKGKIDNIFKLKTKNNFVINLIRTKAMRDIVDNDMNFNNYKELIK